MLFVIFVVTSVAVATGPLVNTVAMLFAIFVVTSVAVAIEGTANPHHAALTVSLAVFQFAFVDATRKDMLGLGFRHFLKM